MLGKIEARSIPEPNTGCWLWLGHVNDKGYGRTAMNGETYAHRVALKLTGVDITGKLVLHRCDQPSCVNPAHLYPGDNSANMADMKRRGRSARGEDRQHKLTTADVRAIRASPLSNRKAAAAFGVSNGVIQQIRTRKKWRHVL